MAMTRTQFKKRWESDANGDGITFDEIAECAVAWGLFRSPKTCSMSRVRYAVLKAARTHDAEEYKPEETDARLQER